MPEEPTEASRSDFARVEPVWWGAGIAVGSFGLAFVIYVIGDTILAFAANGLYKRDVIAFGIVAYQFLALGVATCVVLLLVHRPAGGLQEVGFRTISFPAVRAALLSLVPIFIGVALLTAAFSTFFPSYHLQGNAQQELPVGNHVSVLKAIAILLWAGVEAPLVEETLFRGIVFQGVVQVARKRFGRQLSVFLGAVGSGLLFGFAHFEPHTLPILAFLGIALAYVFSYTRSIYGSMLVHGAVNVIAALSVLYGT